MGTRAWLAALAVLLIALCSAWLTWWLMDDWLSACRNARYADRQTIETLRAANADLHRSLTEQGAAVTQLATEAKAAATRAASAVEQARKGSASTRQQIVALTARLASPAVHSMDCASAAAEVRASLR